MCRAGANTVTEVAAVGLPAAFVPLPIGNGEQAHNAHPVVRAGGALLIDDEALTPTWIDRVLVPLVTDPERLAAMSSAASDLVPRDADVRLADMVDGVPSRSREDPDPRRDPPGRPARTRALHRHRRRGAVRRSPGS